MIKNERQYRITKSQIARFEAALGAASERGGTASLKKLEANAMRSQLDELRREVQEFERLRSGKHERIHIDSFDELPHALVRGRIAAGMSQKDLAERLGLPEQQIQRYESTDYASASLMRLKEVIEALGANIAGELTYSR